MAKTPKQRENEQHFLEPNAQRLQAPYSNLFRSMMRGKKRGDGLVPDENRLEDLKSMTDRSKDEAIELFILNRVQSEYKSSNNVPTLSTENFGRGDSLLDIEDSKRTLTKIAEFFNRMRESTDVVPEDVFLTGFGTEDRRARKKGILDWIEQNVMA